MTLGPFGTDDGVGEDAGARQDPSIVPGLAEPSGDEVGPGLRRVRPLDVSKDPDRMPPGEGQSLTDLLGKERSYEEDRDGYEWILGLLGVLAFLALVAFFFTSVLNP